MLALQRRLEPHLLRRIKEDVATDIPAKEETIIDVELTTLQKQYVGWGVLAIVHHFALRLPSPGGHRLETASMTNHLPP